MSDNESELVQNVFQYISNISANFQLKILQSDILQQFFNNAFFEEMNPMFEIHNISIATDDDIIQFGDDINIYPYFLSRAIIIWRNCLNWLEKTIVSDNIFCQFLVS